MVLSMLLWGLSWPSGKILTHYGTAVNFAVYRYIIVCTTLLVFLLATRAPLHVARRGYPFVAGAGILLALYSYLFFKGLQAGAAGAGGVMVTTLNPLMAYALGLLLDRRRPKPNETMGLLTGIEAGCCLLKVWDQSASLLASGNLYFLAAALTWAALSKLTSKSSQFGSPMGFSLWQYMVTLLCLLPLMDTHELMAALAIRESTFWLNLLFSSVIVTTLATTIYFYATARLGAEKASSFIFLVPLAAAVSSWLLLGEHIHPHTAAGGLLGIGAVYLINRRRYLPAMAATQQNA